MGIAWVNKNLVHTGEIVIGRPPSQLQESGTPFFTENLENCLLKTLSQGKGIPLRRQEPAPQDELVICRKESQDEVQPLASELFLDKVHARAQYASLDIGHADLGGGE